MPGAPSLTEIEQTLEDILKPLHDQLAVVDNELKALAERKAELREVRSKITRLLGANTKPGPKPGPKSQQPKTYGTGKPSAARLDSLESYLRSAVNGDEFTVPDLSRREDWINIDTGYVNNLMNFLHERGSVRLVRTGHPEYGNRTKTWRLTNNA